MASETEQQSPTSPKGKSAICGSSGATPPDIRSRSPRRCSSSPCRRRRRWRSPTASSRSSTRASVPAGSGAQRRRDRLPLSAGHRRRAGRGDRHALFLRVVDRRAHRRRPAHRGSEEPADPAAPLLRGEPAVGDRLAADRRHRDPRAGRRLQRFDRAEEHRHRARRHRLSVPAVAQAGRVHGDRHPVGLRSGGLLRPPDPQPQPLVAGPHRRRRLDRVRDARAR